MILLVDWRSPQLGLTRFCFHFIIISVYLFVEYGCVILNDIDLNLIDLCLPLITKKALFIVTTLSTNASELKSKLESKFSSYQTMNIESTHVVAFGSTEPLDPAGERFEKVLSLVQDRIKADNSMDEGDSQFSWDFSKLKVTAK